MLNGEYYSFGTKPVSALVPKWVINSQHELQFTWESEQKFLPSFVKTSDERVKPDISYFLYQDNNRCQASVPCQGHEVFPQSAEYQSNAMYPPNAAYPQNSIYPLNADYPQSNENTIYVRNLCEEEYQAYREGCQGKIWYGYQQGYQQENLQNSLHENFNRFNSSIKAYESYALAEPVEEHENPESRNVIDLIGDDYLKWNNIEPIFIDAPTGSGKTTFVYKKLIHDAIDNKHGVLIVSNRIALSMQQKRQIYDIVKEKDADSLNNLKKEEITDETYLIGPVCVTTYQSLKNRFLSEYLVNERLDIQSQLTDSEYELYCWSRTLRYAVFDEIHILYADAEFNGFCHELLRFIPFVFRDVVRVYMTATSYEVIDYIKKYEAMKYSLRPSQSWEYSPFWQKMLLMDNKFLHIFNWKVYERNVKRPALTRLIRYTIKPDYSRYNLKFFYPERKKKGSGEGEISIDGKAIAAINVLKQIKPSKNNKVIVFVDDKSVGEQICNNLKYNKVTAAVITKDKSKSKNVWKNIVENERFDESVLITTQVLDSGVNIKDKSVKNIIIFYTDRTQFIQSLGRKRLNEDEGNVTVWAYVPSDNSFIKNAENYRISAETAIKLFYSKYYNASGIGAFAYLKKYLTNRHYTLLERFPCDFYPSYSHMFASIFNERPKTSTLVYPDYSATINSNIYVLGVILGKIEYLKQFVYPDNNGVIKDYREEVCDWLGKQNVLVEIKEKQEAEHKEQAEALKNVLEDAAGKTMQDKEFERIRKMIIKTYMDSFPKGKLSGRSDNTIKTSGEKVLNELLDELGLDYVVKVKRMNKKGRNKTQHFWQIEERIDIPSTTEA